MNVMLVYDKDNETEHSKLLKHTLINNLGRSKVKIELFMVTRENVRGCTGCIKCWLKTPGECVMNDLLNTINRSLINSDLVIFITAIMFGQYSSAMKNVMDRFIPNVLPFFIEERGMTIHPGRYEKYPNQILIGYGSDLMEEERDTFLTLTSGKYNKTFDEVFISVTDADNKAIVDHIRL